jgi:hypothetical protein
MLFLLLLPELTGDRPEHACVNRLAFAVYKHYSIVTELDLAAVVVVHRSTDNALGGDAPRRLPAGAALPRGRLRSGHTSAQCRRRAAVADDDSAPLLPAAEVHFCFC